MVHGQREGEVAVALEQVVAVPGAVADVDLRVAQVGDDEGGAAGAERDPRRGLGEELHEANRPCLEARVRVESALHVDDRREQGRIEA